MKRLIALILPLLTAGCHEQGPTPEQLAAMAAKGYYQHLQQGQIDDYLEGMAGYNSMPPDYRAEHKTNIRMFLHQQMTAHGGIASVEAVNGTADTMLHVVYAMLSIHFNDSTHEEICVPMVEKDGKWVMK